jgi:hypothetical protein
MARLACLLVRLHHDPPLPIPSWNLSPKINVDGRRWRNLNLSHVLISRTDSGREPFKKFLSGGGGFSAYEHSGIGCRRKCDKTRLDLPYLPESGNHLPLGDFRIT